MHKHKWVKEREDSALIEAKCECGAAVGVETTKDGRVITLFEPQQTAKAAWEEELLKML